MIKIILIQLYYTTIFISCQFLRPGGDPMLTIGIYHNCPSQNNDINNIHKNANNNTNLNNHNISKNKNAHENLTEANACQRTARIMMKSQHRNTIWTSISADFRHANAIIKLDDMEYMEMEFCQMDEAVNIILDLKLNQTFLISNKQQQHIAKWNKLNIIKWRSQSRILFIMIHSPVKYSRTLASLLYGDDTPVVLLNSHVQIPISLQDKNLVTNYELAKNGHKSILSTVFNKHKIKYFAIVWLQDSLFSRIEFELFYKEMTEVYHQLKLCFVLYRLKRNDPNNTKTFFSSVKKDKHLNYIAIFGNQSASIDFLWMYRMEMNYRKFHLIFFDLSRKAFTQGFMDVTKTEIFTLNNQNIDKVPAGHLDTIASQVSRRRSLETARTIETCYKIVINQYTNILRIIDVRQKFGIFENTVTYTDFKKLLYNRLIDKNQMKKSFYLVSMLAGNNVRFHLSKSHDVLESQSCQTIKCGVGKERILSNIKNNDRLWNQSYGWTCKQCLPNQFKPIGDESAKCQECASSLLIPTEDQGGCYDPFVFISQTFYNSTPIKLASSLCAIGFISALTISIIFTRLRNTPLVKALDFHVTLVHLLLSSFLFLACPFVFIGETGKQQCILRPLFVLLLCIAPSTLIVGKSHKIVKAFNTKTRLSISQKRNAMIMQHSISGFIVLVDSAILLLTFAAYPAQVTTHLDYVNFTIRQSCNTHLHVNIQIGLLIIQYSFTMVQAYRARNLPGPFNEAISIVYSSFIGVVSCFITFPIFYLQSDKQVKQNVHIMVLPISQLLFLVVFYGKKVWFVMMESQKNTQQYVRHQMMKLAQTQVDNQMMNRKH